jgi:hypothetical protein
MPEASNVYSIKMTLIYATPAGVELFRLYSDSFPKKKRGVFIRYS